MPLRAAISLMVVPFMSPVSLNARRAAARIELLRASAVSLRRGGAAADASDAVSGDAVSGTVTAFPAFCGVSVPGRLCPWKSLSPGVAAPGVCTHLHVSCFHFGIAESSQLAACRSAQGDFGHRSL